MTNVGQFGVFLTRPTRRSHSVSLYLEMMCKLFVLVLVAVVPLVSMAEELSYEKLEKMEDLWMRWKNQHGKVYSPKEEIFRRMVFFKSLLSIEEHNSKYPVEVSYTKGLNQFSDMTFEEYRAYNKLNSTATTRITRPICKKFVPLPYKFPATVDWRQKGYVTAVKNQGECGSCWAFSTTGSVEGQHFRKTGTLLSLSEQQMVDCSVQNSGCDGGVMDRAFEYIMTTRGLETEENYPYTGQQGDCESSPALEQAPIVGCVDVIPGNETALEQAVASVGPISVGIDASHESFQYYSGGVYYEPQCSSKRRNLDHGVLVVGYGTDLTSGQKYWLVKNSWSDNWGVNGYIKMARNRDNNCGIATLASYPTI